MNFKISNLRIFAILSVVFGHSIIIYSSTWNLMKTDVASPLFDALKTGINFYQMELYFFIAGFLVYHSLQKNVSVFTFIKKKAIRLLIPYLAFGFLWMIPIKIWLDIPGYHGQKLSDIIFLFLTGRNTGHLWFLLALFEIMLFLYPVLLYSFRQKGKEIIFMVMTFALCCLMLSPYQRFIHYNFFNVSSALNYAFYFSIGLLFNAVKCGKTSRKCFILFLLFIACWLFFADWRRLVSYVLTISFFLIFPDKESRLSFLDQYSFGIYLLHSPLIYITFSFLPNVNPCWMLFINFGIMGSLALAIAYVIKNTPISRYLKI